MIPLLPSLVLAFVSFICSAFVILRIVIPILPPGPLSKRVKPSEFGLPNFRSLSLVEKAQLWLHSLDIISLVFFVWQAASEYTGGASGFGDAADPASTIRLWLAMTLRQAALLVVSALTLLHVRMAQPVSFGARHWMLWGPSVILVISSTSIAAVVAAAGVTSLFVGLVAYTTTIAVLTSAAFVCLIATLLAIKRNLAVQEDSEPWPPMEEKPRPSFATEDVDVLRDGASWITSNASSRRGSVSAWSFSTHHTVVPSSNHGHTRRQSGQSVHSKSQFWFEGSGAPPVPPLPASYGPLSPTAESLADADPFRRDSPTPVPEEYFPTPHDPRQRSLGSQNSWLTSTNGSQTVVSAWSFPPSQHGDHYNASSPNLNAQLLPATSASRPVTPTLANAQVLGGYGYNPQKDSEKGLGSLAAAAGTRINISMYHAMGWLIEIWLPLALAYPYFISAIQGNDISTATNILFILSLTTSAPVLLLNVLCKAPLPIPIGLFDSRSDKPAPTVHETNPFGSSATYWPRKSTTTSVTTVVESRRSGDVWISNGDAVDGKGKVGRALGMINPTPKLSVLPSEDNDDEPPTPFRNDDSLPVHLGGTPRSEISAQFGRLRKESKASSHLSAAEESMAFASRILVAQRHYSALAQTLKVSTSPERRASTDGNMMPNTAATSGVASRRTSGHLRTRSGSSVNGHLRTRSVSSVSAPQTASPGSFQISPPPAMPLPPTPPNVRAARLAKHKKSFSSGFSFGPVDDLNQIDALTAGVLPLLVPGLRVGENMRIKDGDYTPPGTLSKGRKDKKLAQMLQEFGGELSSPEYHSTPAARQPRGRKTSAHKRNHWSLPSLSLGKDGLWGADLGRAFESKVNQYMTVPSQVDVRRNTVFGAEAIPNNVSRLQMLKEENESHANLGRAFSTRSLGLRPEVPHNVDTARSSLSTLPPSATATLFELDDDSGPQAESTPHNNAARKRISDDIPPVPTSRPRSSIIYIKSDDTTTPATPEENVNAPTTSAIASLAQWSSRAVRLMPKASILQRKTSTSAKVSPPTSSKTASRAQGLRPLSLLQDRDVNVPTSSPIMQTRPLQVGKKNKTRTVAAGVTSGGENRRPENQNKQHRPSKNKNLKSLQLMRSETSKMRGVLRQNEVLPDVVVRPPSENMYPSSYGYTFEGY